MIDKFIEIAAVLQHCCYDKTNNFAMLVKQSVKFATSAELSAEVFFEGTDVPDIELRLPSHFTKLFIGGSPRAVIRPRGARMARHDSWDSEATQLASGPMLS